MHIFDFIACINNLSRSGDKSRYDDDTKWGVTAFLDCDVVGRVLIFSSGKRNASRPMRFVGY